MLIDFLFNYFKQAFARNKPFKNKFQTSSNNNDDTLLRQLTTNIFLFSICGLRCLFYNLPYSNSHLANKNLFYSPDILRYQVAGLKWADFWWNFGKVNIY